MEFVQHCSCKIARCTPIHYIIIPLEIYHDLAEFNEIFYCWIPSHIGIAGKENEDQKAKDSLNLHPTNFPLPHSNGKPFINRHILNKWQMLWNNSVGFDNLNKLYEMSDKKKSCLLVYVLETQG